MEDDSARCAFLRGVAMSQASGEPPDLESCDLKYTPNFITVH
ncbi:hypothetical protein RvY_10902 [Ramazzottius varieornatus]|uniref:Uncharacterized protein n=1 Tax=Ramazzottius varieornatus TaxID=947166 RepID=A0A1D1VM36_RAMVA|nr:hypothetical protein RvY_10902 [Ramazzottius varieornatus]